MAAVAYLIMGPSPWLEKIGIIIGSFPKFLQIFIELKFRKHFKVSSIGQVTVSMVLLGASLSAAVIPTCSELMEAARRERCEERASSFISGWLNSLIFLGEFLGPLLGGLLLDL